MKKISLALSSIIILASLSGCGSSSNSSGSFGDACPILQLHATEMAMVISSVPVAVDYDQRKAALLRTLPMTSFTDVQSLKRAFNSDVNTVLGFTGSNKPPTGEVLKTIEDLRLNVWNWDWTSISSVKEVETMMSGFAAIDEGCSKA